MAYMRLRATVNTASYGGRKLENFHILPRIERYQRGYHGGECAGIDSCTDCCVLQGWSHGVGGNWNDARCKGASVGVLAAPRVSKTLGLLSLVYGLGLLGPIHFWVKGVLG
ncbi:Ribonucleoside-diphosphate reductase subunit alpha [Gossypium arboreum]|uniref:Ribonucleoside-diphosphate reductase subunit alpha n=1 Tax=Gossypium arboreum TaxID=29729 RepID=A0A0B0NBW7_GOSAR|nr:Ribonucleoside-diphosphate reductase subunit alpha [Gossypium arboreum]